MTGFIIVGNLQKPFPSLFDNRNLSRATNLLQHHEDAPHPGLIRRMITEMFCIGENIVQPPADRTDLHITPSIGRSDEVGSDQVAGQVL